jgi:hypothetical protein
MLPPLFLLAWPTLEPHDQVARGEGVKRFVHLGERREAVQPFAPRLELADRLCAAQHQDREQRALGAGELQRFVEQVPVLDRAARRPAREAHPASRGQALERVADRGLVVVDHGLAVRGLVAGEPERVQRQWIRIRSRPLLLDQAAEDSELDCVRAHFGVG